MHVVLNMLEPLSLTLMEECRLRVFENRVWGGGGTLGHKSDEVTGVWGRLLDDLYASPNIIRGIK
jgi:hypothetical protein